MEGFGRGHSSGILVRRTLHPWQSSHCLFPINPSPGLLRVGGLIRSRLGVVITLFVSTGKNPPTLNRERSQHWAVRAKLVREWHDATWAATSAVRLQRFERAGFEFIPRYPTRRLPDTTAVYPASKAIVDALVHLRVIPDDNAFHNAYETHHAPVHDPSLAAPGIQVNIHGLSGIPEHDCSCVTRREQAEVKRATGRKG